MKKYLLILFLICLLFLTSCQNKANNTEKVKEDETQSSTDAPSENTLKILDSLDYKLGENLPTISFSQKVIEYSLSEEDIKNEVIASYDVLTKNLTFNVLRFNRSGHSIEEALDAQINSYYPDQNIKGYTDNHFDETSTCKYGYYCAYDSSTYDLPYYIITNIFEEGEDFVEADFWYEAQQVKVDDDFSIYLPISLFNEVVLTVEELRASCLSKYESNDEKVDFSVEVYKNDYKDDNYDALIEEKEKDYGSCSEVDLFIDGAEYKALSLDYSSDDGHFYECYFINNGSLFTVRFISDNEINSLNEALIHSILLSIIL